MERKEQLDKVAGAYFNLRSETNAQLNGMTARFEEMLGLNPIEDQVAAIRKALDEIGLTVVGLGGVV